MARPNVSPIIIEGTVTIPAADRVDNLIRAVPSLERYLKVPRDAMFWNAELLAVASVANNVRIGMDYGSKKVVDNALVLAESNITFPYAMVNNDFHPRAGDSLIPYASNADAVARTITFRLVLTPNDVDETDTLVMQDIVQLSGAALPVHALAGRQFESVEKPGMLDIYLSASAAAARRAVYIENTNIAPPSLIPATNRIPRTPDDLSVTGIMVPRGKIQDLEIDATSGFTQDIYWRTEFKELE